MPKLKPKPRKPAKAARTPASFTEEVARCCLLAKQAGALLAQSSTDARNRALEAIAVALLRNRDDVLFKNEIDVEAGRKAGLSDALIDRLTLTAKRVEDMAAGLREIVKLGDPLGETVADWTRPDGLHIRKVRVPLGVIAMVYESRPNVTVDSAALCLKSGNAVVLRGGKEAFNSNTALVHILQRALGEAGLPPDCVQLVGTTDRAAIRDLVRMDKLVDLVIPRGGEEMVNAIREMATVPVLSHGKGLCSVYVDSQADLDMAERVAVNAKVQRPGVCNAMETLLVHQDVAREFLPRIAAAYAKNGVEVRGDAETRKLGGSAVKPARPEDFDTEFLDLTVAVRVVPSLEEAIAHVNRHGSHHSDSIITRDAAAAERFLKSVDSAAVFHNASTRLHDGGAFGLGAEMGISTQKLHARGTMGLRELTTTKYMVHGSGQIRR